MFIFYYLLTRNYFYQCINYCNLLNLVLAYVMSHCFLYFFTFLSLISGCILGGSHHGSSPPRQDILENHIYIFSFQKTFLLNWWSLRPYERLPVGFMSF
jgi:hypothetical protein